MRKARAAETVADRWTFECEVHIRNSRKGRRRLRAGVAPAPDPVEPGNVPRVVRVLALAHRFDQLVADGIAVDFADVARLAGITRQRVSQMTALLHLAPDLQEAVLDLPRTVRGRDPIREEDVRAIAVVPEWAKQRRLWRDLVAERLEGSTT